MKKILTTVLVMISLLVVFCSCEAENDNDEALKVPVTEKTTAIIDNATLEPTQIVVPTDALAVETDATPIETATFVPTATSVVTNAPVVTITAKPTIAPTPTSIVTATPAPVVTATPKPTAVTTEVPTFLPQEYYDVFILDYGDSMIADYGKEYVLEDYETYEDATAASVMTVHIGDLCLSGTFVKSKYAPDNYFPTYEYEGVDYSFSVDDTGRITACYFSRETMGNSLSKEKCVAVAEDFLGNICSLDNYNAEVIDDSKHQEYDVVFTKYVDGLRTKDSARVSVGYDGVVKSFNSWMLGRVPSNIDVNKIDFGIVDASLLQKLDKIYANAKVKFGNIDYGEPYVELTLLKDGKIGLVCLYKFDCLEDNGDYTMVYSELMELVVVID